MRYIEWYGQRWLLRYPEGMRNLQKGTRVRVSDNRVTLCAKPDIEVPVLNRVPLKRQGPSPQAPR